MYTCTHVCMYVYENTCAGVFYKKIKKKPKKKRIKIIKYLQKKKTKKNGKRKK